MTEEEVPVLSPVKSFKEENWRRKKKTKMLLVYAANILLAQFVLHMYSHFDFMIKRRIILCILPVKKLKCKEAR